jgi:sugar lactone lactonase YvrE
MKYLISIFFLLLAISSGSQTYDIYVSDAGNFNNPPWQILKFDSAGQNPVVFISSNLSWPQDIVFMPDSEIVLVSNLSSGKISRYDANTGAYISDFATSIGGPTRMKIGTDSLLYVLQWTGDGLVRRYHPDGTFAGNFTSVAVNQSIGFDWDANGNLYVSSYGGKYIRKFDASGNDMGVFIDSLQGPTNIWFKNGDLFVNDYNAGQVKQFDSSGNFLATFISNISQCEGVNFMSNGNILIGSGGSHSVKMYDSAGNYLQDLIPPGTGNLLTPNAIVFHKSSNVSVNETVAINTPLVYPTTGRLFHFSPKAKTARKISVCTLGGEYLQDIQIENTWNSDLPDGYYLLRFDFKDNSQIIEKILVSKVGN